MILYLDDFLYGDVNFQPKKRKYHRHGKRLIVNHNGLDYDQFRSIKDVARYYKINKQTISKYVKNKQIYIDNNGDKFIFKEAE